jgi:diacylglycerol kinase family enzyme
LHLTEREGHAATIMQELIDTPSGMPHIIMTAGGDGTSLEAAERLALLPEQEKDQFGILRLPLGTGNDGSEGRDLVTALGRFLGPVKFERRSGVRITPGTAGGNAPRYAFNIASIGLDAYVAEMTNKVKAKISGDFYKFWVDIASVFYDKVYKVVPMRVKVWDSLGKLLTDETQKRLMVVFGVSGHRQYGSNKPILPSTENVVLVSQTNLFRKMLIKTPIETGRHQGLPEVESYSASKLEVEYDERVLLQCDGETQLLTEEDFPLTFEVVRDLYNVVVPISTEATV